MSSLLIKQKEKNDSNAAIIESPHKMGAFALPIPCLS